MDNGGDSCCAIGGSGGSGGSVPLERYRFQGRGRRQGPFHNCLEEGGWCLESGARHGVEYDAGAVTIEPLEAEARLVAGYSLTAGLLNSACTRRRADRNDERAAGDARALVGDAFRSMGMAPGRVD